MLAYLSLLEEVLDNGTRRSNRTGIDTISSFGHTLKIPLNKFPLVTTKKVHFKSVVHELLWFLRGEETIDFLLENKVRIWNEWADKNWVGPMYGVQWIHWNNQLGNVIQQIKVNPNSRRHVVSAWNVDVLPDETKSPQENVKNGKMALAPCHILFQFNVDVDFLDIAVYQRSMDLFLGCPFNIASYALLTHMVAQQCDLVPRAMTYFIGDAHIYVNHLEQIKEQLSREPRGLPSLSLKKRNSIFEYEAEDVKLLDYNPWNALSGKVAV